MRKTIFSLIGLFLMACLIGGCGESKSAKEAQAKKDSLERVRQDSINAAIAKAREDSIARQDSLEKALKVENTIIFITDFYKKYLKTYTSSSGGDYIKIVEKGCTKKLIKKWKENMSTRGYNEETETYIPCDYDMIIDVQFCAGGGAPVIDNYDNLRVKSLGDDTFEVSLRLKCLSVSGDYHEKKTLRIKVVEENDVTKISEIKDLTPDS